MSTDFFVTLPPDRAEDMRAAIGTDHVPVLSPVPQHVWIHGRGVELAYLLALRELTSEQRLGLIRHIARKFGLPENHVAAGLDRDGVPILAEGCSVTVHSPQRWVC